MRRALLLRQVCPPPPPPPPPPPHTHTHTHTLFHIRQWITYTIWKRSWFLLYVFLSTSAMYNSNMGWLSNVERQFTTETVIDLTNAGIGPENRPKTALFRAKGFVVDMGRMAEWSWFLVTLGGHNTAPLRHEACSTAVSSVPPLFHMY